MTTTIYWAGGEDSSFVALQGATVITSGGFRTAYARSAIDIEIYTSGTSIPLTNFAQTPQFGPASTFWVHGMTLAGGGSVGSAAILLAVADSSGVIRLLVSETGTQGQLQICTRNAAGTITSLATSLPNALLVGQFAPLDLFVNYGTLGQVTLYYNGEKIADTGASVNVTTDAATALAEVYYCGLYATNMYWSECIIANGSTLGMSLQTLPPLAAGNTQSWTGGVADIDETTINDTNFISTTADGALSEWTVNTSLPPGNQIIVAVVQEARVSIGATGPQHFEWSVRTSDGSEYVQGTVAPNTSLNYCGPGIWATNPHTAAAWNAGELVNAGIESLA
jgi:hypothetical protein